MRSRFSDDTRGGVAIAFALALVAMLGAAGVAFDFARARAAQTTLQSAADSAAIAAAIAWSLPQTERDARAARFFSENQDSVTLTSLDIDTAGGSSTVTATALVATTLASVLGFEHVPVTVNAKAVAGGALKTCILLLEPVDTGLSANSGSYLDSDCAVQINSADDRALLVNSNSGVTALSVCVTGKVFFNSGGTVRPDATVDCPAVADPLAGLPEPAEAAAPCAYDSFTVNAFAVTTMSPGVYCNNTVINTSSVVTMLPGVYVFRDGEFLVNSGSSVSGSDVLLFFQGQNGRLNVNSDSQLAVSGRRSGAYQGLVIFQSRDPVTLTTAAHIVNSHSNSKLEGTIYVPNGVLMFNSHADSNVDAAYTAIIARRMDLNSFGTLHVKGYDGTGDTPETASLGFQMNPVARLVE